MISTFDRYLIRRFFHVVIVGFLTTFGLFVVIDAFTNIDGFQERNVGHGYAMLFVRMGEYYLYQASPFLDMVGPILVVISAMVVFAILQKNSEIHPILAAGVPTYRLVVPLLLAAFAVNVLLAANQELVIPAIADHLQTPRGMDESTAQNVDPVSDHATRIAIYGKELYLDQQMIRHASFVLPVPEVAEDLTSLHAGEAVYQRDSKSGLSGWLLKNVRPRFAELRLTDSGRKVVLPSRREEDLIVVSDVTIDQLHQRNMSYRFLPTGELIRRIQSPALGLTSLQGLALHFHERLTKPFLNLLAVLVTVPLVVRKGSSSLVGNLALCTTVLGTLFVLNQACLYLGKVNLISVELAAWLPIILCGTFCAWSAPLVQT